MFAGIGVKFAKDNFGHFKVIASSSFTENKFFLTTLSFLLEVDNIVC